MRLVLVVAVVVAVAPPSESRAACNVDPARELLVTDLSVVEDPARTRYPGPWSFGALIDRIRGDVDAQAFVAHLVRQYLDPHDVNGFLVAERPEIGSVVTDPWHAKSLEHGLDWDLSIAPFRLLGIAVRLDLRSADTGTVLNAGELRFAFGILRPDQPPGQDETLGTIIFEFHIPASTRAEVVAWAARFHKLGSLALGSEPYNAALQELTDKVTLRGAMPNAPNQSAIAQVRSNELISGPTWQWRELHLHGDGLLYLAPVALTPDFSWNRTPLLADFINDNEQAILDGSYRVPDTYQGLPFRGGSSDVEPGNATTHFFTAPGINNNEARHLLSKNTCSGCHLAETGTSFFHLGPRNAGTPTFPSGFLRGISGVPDPVDPSVRRSFNELKRRAADLCSLLP